MPILQSLSRARDNWGDHAAGAVRDASIVEIILGGTSSARDLQDLSALIGERGERTDTISIGDHGSRSVQRSTRRVPVMHPRPSARCHSAPGWCCYAAHHRSSPTTGPGPPAGRHLSWRKDEPTSNACSVEGESFAAV
jgi:hypothetical protein